MTYLFVSFFVCVFVGISFTVHAAKDCTGDNLFVAPYHEGCQELCAVRSDCGGFMVTFGTCYFKRAACAQDLFDTVPRVTAFVKHIH